MWPFAGWLLEAPLQAAYDRHNHEDIDNTAENRVSFISEIEFNVASVLIRVDGFETPAQF